ncbi:hypothetical protein F66182_5106 [Fusarium sp. NRRL 66182]|nr:hypothetical protein F66182_5106 [Fusarium sp. NRRL 66182]
MSGFRPGPVPFSRKDPRMMDPKGEKWSNPDEAFPDYTDSILCCPVVVATEPAYALARKVKRERQKHKDKKERENRKQKTVGDNDAAGSGGKMDKFEADSESEEEEEEEEEYVPPRRSRNEPRASSDLMSALRTCTPECPGYHKESCLAHEYRQPDTPSMPDRSGEGGSRERDSC